MIFKDINWSQDYKLTVRRKKKLIFTHMDKEQSTNIQISFSINTYRRILQIMIHYEKKRNFLCSMFLKSLISVPIRSNENLNKRLKSPKSIFVANIFDVYRFKTWFRIKHAETY